MNNKIKIIIILIFVLFGTSFALSEKSSYEHTFGTYKSGYGYQHEYITYYSIPILRERIGITHTYLVYSDWKILYGFVCYSTWEFEHNYTRTSFETFQTALPHETEEDCFFRLGMKK